jgi:hypothetical protein
MSRSLPPHLAAVQHVLDQLVPRKPYGCHACRDSGDTEYGRPCGWCALGHGPDDTDDEPSADESARLRAIERSYMR